MRKILLVVVVALGLFASALPAQAAALEWKDTENDAHWVLSVAAGVAVTVPTPTEQALDITKVRVEVQGDQIVWTSDLKKLGAANPSTATGMLFRFNFSYGADASFSLSVIDDLGYGKATEFRGGTLGSTNPLVCGRCIGTIDRKNSKVVIKTPISSLSNAIRTVDKTYKALGPGSKLEKVKFTSARTYGVMVPGAAGGYFNFPSDDAAPAGGAPFVI